MAPAGKRQEPCFQIICLLLFTSHEADVGLAFFCTNPYHSPSPLIILCVHTPADFLHLHRCHPLPAILRHYGLIKGNHLALAVAGFIPSPLCPLPSILPRRNCPGCFFRLLSSRICGHVIPGEASSARWRRLWYPSIRCCCHFACPTSGEANTG